MSNSGIYNLTGAALIAAAIVWHAQPKIETHFLEGPQRFHQTQGDMVRQCVIRPESSNEINLGCTNWSRDTTAALQSNFDKSQH